MDQGRESCHLVDLQSKSVDDNEEVLSTGMLEYNDQYIPQDTSPFSRQYPEAQPLGVLHGQIPSPNAGLTMEGDLNESLAGLGLNGNDGFHDSEVQNSILGRTRNIGTSAVLTQRLPETINPMLVCETPYHSTPGAHTILTPSLLPNGSESLSSRLYLSPWSERSSTNLLFPSNAPYKSSAATQSQYSDSAWETVPPSPSVDDFDFRTMPDDDFASMQSHHDLQTGIWSQEDTYRRSEIFPTLTDMGFNNDAIVTRSVPQEVQRFNVDADAAIIFRTPSHSDGDALVHHVGHGADARSRSAASSFTPSSTSGGLVPEFYRPPISDRLGVSIMLNDTLELGASLAQQPLDVERSSSQLSSNRSSFSNIAPRIIVDNPQISATQLPPTLAASPSPPASTSAKSVLRCTHRGCHTTFSAKDAQRRHIKWKHSDKKKLACPVCPGVFVSRPDNMIRHIHRKHPGHPLPAPRSVRKTKATPRRRI